MDGIIAAWMVELGLIAVRDLTGQGIPTQDPFNSRPPYPWELLSSAVVFGILSVIAQNTTARRPATAIAWGLVVATFIGGMESFSQPQGNGALDALGSLAGFLSGGYAKTSGGTTATNAGTVPNAAGGQTVAPAPTVGGPTRTVATPTLPG